MGFNHKLLLAGLAIGISAYVAYKLSKKHEKQRIQAGQQYQWAPPQVGGSNNPHQSWGAASATPNVSPDQSTCWTALRDPHFIADLLSNCVTDQHLYPFYNYDKIKQIAQHIAHSGALYECAEAWKLPPSLAKDLVKLALFDVSFLLDDSLSMRSENSLRIDSLKSILTRAADAGARFDPDGMEVSWINGMHHSPSRIRSAAEASEQISRCRFDGKATPMGHALENVLQTNVLSRTDNHRAALHKPALIIMITDGRPTGPTEHDDKMVRVIKNAKDRLARTRYGENAISLSICAVGNDAEAQRWLDSIDSNPMIGHLVDVTSNLQTEAKQIRASTGIELTEELHCLKVMLGGIDSSYDASDEGTPSGARRRATRQSSMSVNRSAYEVFETDRYHSHRQVASRYGVAGPVKPPFVREAAADPHQNQQWGAPSAPSDWPPQAPYQQPAPYQTTPPSNPTVSPSSTYGHQPPTSYYADQQPSSYGAPPTAQSSYPPSQPAYMNQQQSQYPYSQAHMPTQDAFPPPYLGQGGSSYNNAGPGGFMMPTAEPTSDAYGGYPTNQDRNDQNYQFPSAFPS
ncbi:hypothetical protein CBS101457_000802 [Exobasidium rhododendri]|nr:hypothetical protein CBS101457_000802 [Exobasidium rhododendri]